MRTSLRRWERTRVPEDVVYRPKWRIGLGQIERARRNGIFLQWMTFDEGYGSKPPFLRSLDAMGQQYVGEVGSAPFDFELRELFVFGGVSSDAQGGKIRT
ncbi:MAG: transposase [Phycisphaerales bacterium]|nr:transposase [Phycisphaerales bacterium]